MGDVARAPERDGAAAGAAEARGGLPVQQRARHAFDEGKIDLNALPEKACVAFPGRTPEGLRDLVFMATVRNLPESVGGLEALLESNRPIYRLHYLMFKDKGQIMGFTAYFGLDEDGEARFGSLGRFRFEDHPNGQEARQAVLRALRASGYAVVAISIQG